MGAGGRSEGGALDALRFAAAAFIVLYHFGASAPVPLEEASALFGRGFLATDFFLLLSGYVLGRAYGRALDEGRTSAADFVGRRLARIWPGHLAVLALMAAVVGLAALAGIRPGDPARFTAETFWLQAALAHGWGLTDGESWNTPTWTLSALAVCYLAFPGLWRASRRLAGWRAAGAAAAVMAGAAAVCAGLTGASLFDLPLSQGLVRAAPLFLAGLLLARAAERLNASPRACLAWALGAAGALAAAQAAGRGLVTDVTTFTAVGIMVLVLDRSPWRAAGAGAAARLSFGLYLTHTLTALVWFGLVEAVSVRLQPPAWVAWTAWAAAFPLALASAWMFARFVDAPLQRLVKARPGPRPETARSG